MATDSIGSPSLFLPSLAVTVVLLIRNWKKGTSSAVLGLYFLKGTFSFSTLSPTLWADSTASMFIESTCCFAASIAYFSISFFENFDSYFFGHIITGNSMCFAYMLSIYMWSMFTLHPMFVSTESRSGLVCVSNSTANPNIVSSILSRGLSSISEKQNHGRYTLTFTLLGFSCT